MTAAPPPPLPATPPPRTMSHAFFRSIFRVLPLLIVLLPVNSSNCTMGNKSTEIRVKYENILSHDIEELVNMSAEYRDRCCKNKRRENNKMFCNDTQEIGSLQSMACNMLKLLETKQKFNKEFRRKAALVSCRTLRVLTCKCEEDKIDKVCKQLNMPKNEDVVETAEQPRRKCNQAFCKLKENISSLRSCWNKFEKMISR